MVSPEPTVSVVIPCYNYARYLRGCVGSVLSQTGVQTRVLIIDDTSQDDSADVGRALANEHPNVTFRHHETNKGHIATYNEGLLDWADGDYVTLLSADDMLTEGALGRAVSLMEAHPRVGMVYGRELDMVDDQPPPAVDGRERGTIVTDGGVWLARRSREAVNVVPTPGTVLRTSVQKQVGGYDAALPHAGDFEMWLRVAAVADIGYIRGVPQGLYRIHSASMSQEVYRHRLADVQQRKLVFDAVFGAYPTQTARAGIDPSRTYATLASEPLWLAARAYETGRTAEVPVQECVDTAREIYPSVESLGAFRALSRRRRLGPDLCRRTQVFIGTAVIRKVRNRIWWWRWQQFGG
jgi:hypothetical protein